MNSTGLEGSYPFTDPFFGLPPISAATLYSNCFQPENIVVGITWNTLVTALTSFVLLLIMNMGLYQFPPYSYSGESTVAGAGILYQNLNPPPDDFHGGGDGAADGRDARQRRLRRAAPNNGTRGRQRRWMGQEDRTWRRQQTQGGGADRRPRQRQRRRTARSPDGRSWVVTLAKVFRAMAQTVPLFSILDEVWRAKRILWIPSSLKQLFYSSVIYICADIFTSIYLFMFIYKKNCSTIKTLFFINKIFYM